jgi:hypothetical protein
LVILAYHSRLRNAEAGIGTPLVRTPPARICVPAAWTDSQGSLPKTAMCAYLDDNAMEL